MAYPLLAAYQIAWADVRGQRVHGTDFICSRKSSAVSGYGVIGPDLGGQLAARLVKEGRLDRFSLLRLVPW